MVTSAKDTVASSVTGVVGLARQSRRWSVDLKRSVSHAVDVVLGKSEELVDHFLPMTEDELGEPGSRPPCPRILLPTPHPQRLRIREARDLPRATQQFRRNHTGLEPRPEPPGHSHGPPPHPL